MKPTYIFIIVLCAFVAGYSVGNSYGKRNPLICKLDSTEILIDVWESCYEAGVEAGKNQGFINGYLEGVTK